MTSRNLLPALRTHPNPANIANAPVGEWSRIAAPGELAKLDYGAEARNELRARVQSIPNPWGRMLLFKHALETDLHPARELVEQELLDGLEFLWSVDSMSGVAPRLDRLSLQDFKSQAAALASQRADDLASALLTLAPRRSGAGLDGGETTFDSLVMVVLDGRPVLASSPYTILFTAEDAAGPRTGTYFRYAGGAAPRPLAVRQRAFQQYIAGVILPQLHAAAPAGERNVEWATTKRLLSNWLEKEVRAAGLSVPRDATWEAAASSQQLESYGQPFGGLTLFKRRRGAELATSRWRLRSGRSGGALAPLVVIPGTFDGKFYDGAPTVTLSGDGHDLDRDTLPQLGIQQPWVNPELDWFTDRLLMLDQPVDPHHVHGFRSFQSHYRGDDERLSRAQFALPLRRQLFEYFEPEVLDDILKLEVRDSGDVEIRLTLQLGGEDTAQSVTVVKTYDASKIHGATGPALSLWPSFQDPHWHDYSIFRHDASADTANFLELSVISDARTIPADTERRSDRVRILGVREVPEVLEFRSLVRGTGAAAEDLGVVIPRFRPLEAGTQAHWEVGVDFGTSNTVVSVRDGSRNAGAEFESRDLLLPLTAQDESTQQVQDGYFFPSRIRSGPFGTAVVHFRRLPTYRLDSEPVGVRVNIPFDGHVEGDEHNAVRGELKWSADQNSYFLTAAFLRHLLAVVVARAIQQGIDPSQIDIFWAYPRAFTPAQRNQLAHMWEQVVESFRQNGLAIGQLHDPIDESRAALRYFFNAQQITTAGEASAILDVGGGTSDIAVYGDGRALSFDSVMLGGRNLTGERQSAAAQSHLQNPFVHALWGWAEANQLRSYPAEYRAARKYLADSQDHLAFSYLLGTEWFRQIGSLFTGQPAFHRFQALVFYFYGSLFHYLGLTFRELATRQGEAAPLLPYSVLVAGNGSRYLHWLTDIQPDFEDNPFHSALSRMLVRAAGVDPGQAGVRIPTVRLSEHPKREVALGLVTPVDAALGEERAVTAPLVGEAIRMPTSDGTSRAFAATDRWRNEDILRAADVSALEWCDDRLEIERFHASLVTELASVAGYGRQWPDITEQMRSFFASHGAREIKQAALGKLQYVAASNNGFRGSLFSLEASSVLELMLTELFGPAGSRQTPTAAAAVAAEQI